MALQELVLIENEFEWISIYGQFLFSTTQCALQTNPTTTQKITETLRFIWMEKNGHHHPPATTTTQPEPRQIADVHVIEN